MNKKLLSLLACPTCKGKLFFKSKGILCQNCGTGYPIKNGIPVLVDLDSLPEHLAGQIRYFEAEAEQYTKTYRRAPWEQAYVDRLSSHIRSYKGKTVIDDACGSGYITVESAMRGASVIACDLNMKGLMHLQKIIKAAGLEKNILLVCCSSEQLPLKPKVADIVVANAILEHLPREAEAVKEISRIAKKGAVAMITVPLAYHLLHPLFYLVNYIHDRRIGHLRRYTKETLVARFFDWKALGIYYTGHTRKVLKTLINIIRPTFDEKQIELEDNEYITRKLFASNISIVFQKK